MQRSQYDILEYGDLLDRIRYNHDDGAAYYLIFNKVRPALNVVMRDFDTHDSNEQYDTLMNFYLYLRDGNRKKEGTDGSIKEIPYAGLLLIREPERLMGWVKRTFWIYLTEQAKSKGKENNAERGFHEIKNKEEKVYSLNDLDIAIRLLEVVNEQFSAPERFLFFSDMYALQTGRKELLEELTDTLLCTPGNLRVMRHRIKSKIKGFLESIK